MFLRDKKKLWLLALPLALMAALKLLDRARRPPLLPGIGGFPVAIAFSPDGKTVVCASSNGMVQKWLPDIKKWRSFHRGGRSTDYRRLVFSCLRFSPDNQTLFAGGTMSDMLPSYAWDVATRKRKYEFNYARGAFDVSRDGRWAAVGEGDKMQIVDLQGKPAMPRDRDLADPAGFRWLPSRTVHLSGQATCVAFSPVGGSVAVGNQRSASPLSFWNVGTLGQMPSPVWGMPTNTTPTGTALITGPSPGFSIELLCACWAPDGKRIATLGSGKITIYDLTTSAVVEATWPSPKFPAPWRMSSSPDDIATLAWSPDGKYLFSGGDEVRQWNAGDLKLLRSFRTAGPVAISPDGKTLATANRPEMREPPGVRLVPL